MDETTARKGNLHMAPYDLFHKSWKNLEPPLSVGTPTKAAALKATLLLKHFADFKESTNGHTTFVSTSNKVPLGGNDHLTTEPGIVIIQG